MLLALLTSLRSLTVSDPWVLSPTDDSSFDLNVPIPVIFPRARISKLLQRHSHDEIICQVDTSFVEVYPLSTDQLLVPTNGLTPGPHILKIGIRSADGVYHWKDSRTINLIGPPPLPEPPTQEIAAPAPLSDSPLSIEIVKPFLDKLVPAQLSHVVVTVKISYSGSDSVIVQGALNCDNASGDWFDVAVGVTVGEPIAVSLPTKIFHALDVHPRLVWFDLRAISVVGHKSDVVGGAFELLIPNAPTLQLLFPERRRFPELIVEALDDQSAVFAITGTPLVSLYLEYAFAYNPTEWVRLQAVSPGAQVVVPIPATVWLSDGGRPLDIGSSSLRFRVSDGFQVSSENVAISYGTIHLHQAMPIEPNLTLGVTDLGDLTPAKFAETQISFLVKYAGTAPVSIDVALWAVCNGWINLYVNVPLGEQLVRPLGLALKEVLNLTRAGRYQLVVRAIANGFSSGYRFVDFNLVIPEAPVISLVSPLGGLGPLAREYLGGEKLIFSFTDSDSNDSIAIEFLIPGTKKWVREAVTPGYFFEVVIPASAWVGAADSGVIQFRGTDGTYLSEALVLVSYSLYSTGAVGLRILNAPSPNIFEGDAATFEFSFVDASSPSLTLFYAPVFSGRAGARTVLLENVAPSPSVYVTVPANAFIYDSKGRPSALEFILSDGENESAVTFDYVLAGAVTLTETNRGAYFGPLPSQGDPIVTFQYVVRSNGPLVELQYAFPQDGQKIVWRPWTTVLPRLSAQSIEFPYALWAGAPADPGFHKFVIKATAGGGSDFLNYSYVAPAGTSPTVKITAPEGEFARFFVGTVPRVSVDVTLSGVEGRAYVLAASIGNQSVLIADVVSGQQTVTIPTGFWSTQRIIPGTFTIPFYVAEMKNGKIIDASNLQHLSYTVQDGLTVGEGQLKVLYGGFGDLKVPALKNDAKIPLIINFEGYRGTGPLRLEYSVVSPPVWTAYPGAIGTGRATYSVPRAPLAESPRSQLTVRVSRDLVKGSTSTITLTQNVPPGLELVSPITANFGKIYQWPVKDPPQLSSLFTVTDSGDTLTLSYSVDDAHPINYATVQPGTSIDIRFLREILDLSPGVHVITVKVSDDVESSLPAALTYEVIPAPKIVILSPPQATWGDIRVGAPLSLILKVQSVQNESVTLEYVTEGGSVWTTFARGLRVNQIYNVTIPSTVLTGVAVTPGLHYLSVRAQSRSQYSESVPVWYSIGVIPGSPPVVLLGPGQKPTVTVPSCGPNAGQRKVSLIIKDVGNAGVLRLDYRAGLGPVTAYGHFSVGQVKVSLPAEVFFANPLNGSSFSIIFSAFDGVTAGNSATVTYFVNQPPTFTIDPPGPLVFGVGGPDEDLKLKLSINDPDSNDFIVKYRFDEQSGWRTSRRVRRQVFTREIMAPYLSYTRPHRLHILVSDGIENSTGFIEYSVTPPASRAGPTISLPRERLQQRFHYSGPLRQQRTFDLTLTERGRGFMYVGFSIDGGSLANVHGYDHEGTYSVTIPEGFFTPCLSPGAHKIQFTVSDEFGGNSVVSRYYVNTPPVISIVSPKTDVAFYPNTPNPLTVVFSVADVDRDRLTLQYKYDADPIWTNGESSFTGSEVTWNMRVDWGKPFLSVGLHKVRFQVHDGLDASQVVIVNYRVAALGVPLAEEGEGVSVDDEESWVDFSVNTLPGMAIGIAITIIAAVIAIFVGRKTLGRKSQTTSSSVYEIAPIKVP